MHGAQAMIRGSAPFASESVLFLRSLPLQQAVHAHAGHRIYNDRLSAHLPDAFREPTSCHTHLRNVARIVAPGVKDNSTVSWHRAKTSVWTGPERRQGYKRKTPASILNPPQPNSPLGRRGADDDIACGLRVVAGTSIWLPFPPQPNSPLGRREASSNIACELRTISKVS